MLRNRRNKTDEKLQGLPKIRTCSEGLDEITVGGPPTLIAGSAGCGKTTLALGFLIRGATRYDEPGGLSDDERVLVGLDIKHARARTP